MGILLSGMTEAEATAAGNSAGMGVVILLYVAVLGVMYLIFMRPQKKEQKKVAAMLASLEEGDCVLTTSGFYGIVINIEEDTVIVEFGNDKHCRIPMEKTAISRVEKPDAQS